MTEGQFKQIIARLEVVWGQKFDDLKADIYAESLSHLDFERLLLAVKALTQTEKFCPAVALIQEKYNEHENPLPSVSEAWLTLSGALRIGRYAYRDAMDFAKRENPLVCKIITELGFINLCNADPKYLRRDFEGLYRKMAAGFAGERVIPPSIAKQIAELKNNLVQQGLESLTVELEPPVYCDEPCGEYRESLTRDQGLAVVGDILRGLGARQ